MKTPSIGDVVTIIARAGKTERAQVKKSYKRRFIVLVPEPVLQGWGLRSEINMAPTARSFERSDEGKTWVRGWDEESAVAFRAQVALAGCR